MLVHEDAQDFLAGMEHTGYPGTHFAPKKSRAWPLMKEARRARDCLPLPPTPTNNALPQGFAVMRQMPLAAVPSVLSSPPPAPPNQN